jgi:hypothetical protein
MPPRYPIGLSDFRALREQGLVYVDKSALIAGVLDDSAAVLLLPRPRRFGKTLNLSMLRCFLERSNDDLSHLFEGLWIWGAGAEYRGHFRRYPVLALTFKDVKAATFEEAWTKIRLKIQDLFDQHRYLLDGAALSALEAARFRSVLDDTAPRELYHRALADLSRQLHRHHGEKVVILIDEYDEPIHAGFAGGYTQDIVGFFRAFLTEGLKDNPHLYKGILTGILRVARESIFSGLNNLGVYTLLHPRYSTAFGFTEPEVEALLAMEGRPDLTPEVRRWYNGYVFGGAVIYNPWSILNFAASQDKLLRNYWVSTSANDLVKELLQERALGFDDAIDTLLEGGSIERTLDENVALTELRQNERALWSLLVFSGYLRAEAGTPLIPNEVPPYRLSIPNREVREVYSTTFSAWLNKALSSAGGHTDRLTKALFSGDAEALEAQLQAFVSHALSYHDTASPAPEHVYHAFVVGLLAALEPRHQVRSNRESGAGRPDVLIRPARPGLPGALLELKVAKPGKKSLDQALAEGEAQIVSHNYQAELVAAGATPVHAFAVAFDGKEVRVRAVIRPLPARGAAS